MEVLEDPKSELDMDILLQEVNASPFIGQLTRKELGRFIADRTIRFFYEADKLVGFGAWEEIDSDWCEIGPFYNMQAFRRKGLGTQIVQLLVTLNTGKKMYAVTKNPIVSKVMLKLGFHKVGVLALPWPIYRHLLARVSVSRLLNLARKISSDPVSHYLKT